MKVLAFGIVRDIFNNSFFELDKNYAADTDQLKLLLEERFPRLKALASYMIAVNDEYAAENVMIHDDDEIALIPPVSGG